MRMVVGSVEEIRHAVLLGCDANESTHDLSSWRRRRLRLSAFGSTVATVRDGHNRFVQLREGTGGSNARLRCGRNSGSMASMDRPPRHRNHDDEGRAMCRRCHRPLGLCLCRHLPRGTVVENRTPVTILQHPRERFHPKGTVGLLRLGLARVEVVVAHFNDDGEPARRVAGLPEGTGLLYPCEGSRRLEDVAVEERPTHLLLLDGTWGNAHRLYRSNPWLAELPHYHLEPRSPERYRIRGEPDERGRSTLEAVVEALRILEPHTAGLDRLLGAFEAMIDDQVAIIEREAAGSRRRTRFGEPHPIHAPLTERAREVVLVYTESVACADGQRRAVHWAALRPGRGDPIFERLLRVDPESGPNERHLAHMGLTAGDLASGTDAARLRRDWNAFVGQDAVVTAWNQSTLDLVAAQTDGPVCPVLLKAAWCNLRRCTSGTLEAVLEREGLTARDLPVRGRAGLRLGQALAVLGLFQTSEPPSNL